MYHSFLNNIFYIFLFFTFYIFINNIKLSKLLLGSVGTARGSWDTGPLCPTLLLLPYGGVA